LEEIIIGILSFIFGAVLSGLGVGFFYGNIRYQKGQEDRKKSAETQIGSAEKEASRILSEAGEKANAMKKTALVEAKEEIFLLKDNAEKEISKQKQDNERDLKERRTELTRAERRLQQKEETIERRNDKIERLEENLAAKNKSAQEKLDEAETTRQSQLDVLQRISGFTVEQAKEQILKQVETQLDHEKAVRIKTYEAEIKETCEDTAREHIALAISRLASETVTEITVSVVQLPNDEIKGRIIGREGRNIRTLEQLTGVDLIIDDTPEVITLSSHDKIKREIARLSLEKLIQDGRIHPTRIEETVEKAKKEIETKIRKEGEHAVIDANVNNLNPDLVKLLGRLYFRTSYTQNVLAHSLEVAHLSGLMAAELGIDTPLARRAGLLHDIGKALTHEHDGSHVTLGADICKKYKESPEVIHAIEAHHGDVEAKTIIAAIVQAADAISAARPGARNENYENYIKRLQKLEEICKSYDGVENTYAIQAGREVRVMIKPSIVNDDSMELLAHDIAKKIENKLQYPGQIKVHLIRESRTFVYAK
jgi:ribonuclease Y